MGDFWSTFANSKPSSDCLCEFVIDNGLSQLVNGPTHSQGNMLDLVITNIEERINNLTINLLDQFTLQSDHCAITYTMFVSKQYSRSSTSIIFPWPIGVE